MGTRADRLKEQVEPASAPCGGVPQALGRRSAGFPVFLCDGVARCRCCGAVRGAAPAGERYGLPPVLPVEQNRESLNHDLMARVCALYFGLNVSVGDECYRLTVPVAHDGHVT